MTRHSAPRLPDRRPHSFADPSARQASTPGSALGLGLGIGLGLMQGLGAIAPATAAEPAVFQLGEIQVMGAPATDISRGLTIIPAEDMAQLNRNTVEDALRLAPGVTVSSVGARQERVVSVRGFDPRQVPLLVDGIPVLVPYDGYADLGRFTTFDLSEIQVTKGFTSVLAGPNTMGGVINLVTRKPTRTLEGSAQAGMIADGGGVSGYLGAASIGTRQEKGYAIASVSRLDRNHVRLSDDFTPSPTEDGGTRENSYRRDSKLNLKLAYTPNATDEYALNLVYQHGVKGTPPYAGTDPNERVRYWRWPYWDKKSIAFLSNTAFANSGYLKTRLYWDQFNNRLSAFDDATYTTQALGSSFRSYYDEDAYGGSTEIGGKIFERDTLKAAVHYRHDIHREHNAGEPIRQFSDSTYSLALENTFALTPRLDLVTGARYDWRIAGQAEDYSNGAISAFDTPNSHAFNPQTGLVYRFSDSGSGHAVVSRSSRFATLKDRFSYRFGRSLPNPDIAPELATTAEIGISEQIFGTTRLEGAVFYSSITDTIQQMPLNDGTGRFQYRNVGKASAKGFEISLRSALTDRLLVGAGYTFTDREIDDSSIRPTDSPRHKLTAFADYTPWEGLHLVPDLEYNASRWVITSSGFAETDGFWLLNAKVAYDLTPTVQLEARVGNLLDAHYETSYGFPEEGRTYFLGVRSRF